MKQKLKYIIPSIIFVILFSPLFAQETQAYENSQKGFSLSYPANWVKTEHGEKLEFYSSKEFSSNYKNGVMFGIYYYPDKGDISAEQVLRELLDVEKEFELAEFTRKDMAKQSWSYTTAVNSKRDIRAEFYVCTRGKNIYVIACGYTPAEARKQFSKDIDLMLQSFAFTGSVEKSSGSLSQYNNKGMGVAFSYPSAWTIDEEKTHIFVGSDKDLFQSDNPGAGVAIYRGGATTVDLKAVPKTKEELWNKLKEQQSEFKEISRSTKNWQGVEWLYVEFEDPHSKILAHFYMYVHDETIYMVGVVFHPQQAQAQYEENIKQILDSMEFMVSK